jgi:ectoine hydroxylase-related dioxygenase (phytanoyl-CoA dioxygenase family)
MPGLFLQPDAARIIQAMTLPPLVRQHALEVVEKGYTLIKGAIAPEACAQAIADFRKFEAANEQIFAANRNENGHYARIVNLHTAMPDLLKLFTQNKVWLAVQDVLFGAPTALYTSLFYEVGSQQPMHRDTPVFATRPEYLYFGSTVYLEPAGDENGCLEVMEGGHLLEELDREAMALVRYGNLAKLPDLDDGIWNEYQDSVVSQGLARGLPVKRLYAEPGDSLIWHPQLPHGGTPIVDRTRTRFSLVMHNTPVGVPVYHQRAFFNPDAKLPETAAWSYREVDGRQIADFRHGVSFDHHNNYTLDQFVLPGAPLASPGAPLASPDAPVAEPAAKPARKPAAKKPAKAA